MPRCWCTGRRGGRAVAGLALAACLAALPLGAAPPVGGDAPPASIRRLVDAFRRARGAAAREASADEVLAGGADAAGRLQPVAEAECSRLRQAYAGRFQRAAADVLKDRRRTGDPAAEVAELRRTILDVAAADALTKDMIDARSDPALRRLEALLAVTPAEVADRDPQIATDRAELTVLAAVVRRCRELRGDAGRKAGGAAPRVVDDLAEFEELCCLLAGPVGPTDRETLTANAAVARDLDPEEARGILRLNRIRLFVGLPAQAIDPRLVAACRVHSRDMADKGFFAHESPVPGRETPWRRAEAAGTSADAENIFSGGNEGPAAIDAWWHSPGHHKNMLGGQRRTGLGRWEQFWTQLFG